METNLKSNAEPKQYPEGKVIENLPFEEYARINYINQSGLKEILRSPAHFEHYWNNHEERKQTDALLFGKNLHFAVLEPRLFLDNYVTKPDFDRRTKIGKENHERWLKDLKPGAIIVPEEQVEPIKQIIKKLREHKLVGKMFQNGIREGSFFWTDPITGEKCKARPDFLNDRSHLIDLKTTSNAQEDAFMRSAIKYNYALQAAHYCEGARVTGVAKSKTFIFIAVEKTPPYCVAIYPAGTSLLAYGERQREKAMKIYSECKKTGIYPGYNEKARSLELPDWIFNKELEDEED